MRVFVLAEFVLFLIFQGVAVTLLIQGMPASAAASSVAGFFTLAILVLYRLVSLMIGFLKEVAPTLRIIRQLLDQLGR